MPRMPSGREIHTVPTYKPPALDDNVLAKMRAPVDSEDRAFRGFEEDSGEDDVTRDDASEKELPGAFPGSTRAYY